MEQLTPLERELLKASGEIGRQVQSLEKNLQTLTGNLLKIGNEVAKQSANASASANKSLMQSLSGYERRVSAIENGSRSLETAFGTLLDRLAALQRSASDQHNSLSASLSAFSTRLSVLEKSQASLTAALKK